MDKRAKQRELRIWKDAGKTGIITDVITLKDFFPSF